MVASLRSLCNAATPTTGLYQKSTTGYTGPVPGYTVIPTIGAPLAPSLFVELTMTSTVTPPRRSRQGSAARIAATTASGRSSSGQAFVPAIR